jgi:ABC-type cobalamin transport system permease subunit
VAFHYPEFVCSAVPAGIVVLDRAHQSEAAAIVRARLLLAGARLAALLEQALAMPGPTRRQ